MQRLPKDRSTKQGIVREIMQQPKNYHAGADKVFLCLAPV